MSVISARKTSPSVAKLEESEIDEMEECLQCIVQSPYSTVLGETFSVAFLHLFPDNVLSFLAFQITPGLNPKCMYCLFCIFIKNMILCHHIFGLEGT